jgi:hypothetical protein
MARKPKIQPSPDDAAFVLKPKLVAPDEAPAPSRQGRKLKAAALSFASPAAADVGNPATDDAGADASKAGPTKAPGRKGQGRKPKQAAGAEAAPSIQDGAAEPQGQTSRPPEAEAIPDLIEDGSPTTAAASQAETAGDSDSVQPDRDPVSSADGAAQSVPEAEASVPAAPAAHWDRATDRVQFDWPAIERVAAQDGPNQGMAKLLVTARAEGAGSRWPF